MSTSSRAEVSGKPPATSSATILSRVFLPRAENRKRAPMSSASSFSSAGMSSSAATPSSSARDEAKVDAALAQAARDRLEGAHLSRTPRGS